MYIMYQTLNTAITKTLSIMVRSKMHFIHPLSLTPVLYTLYYDDTQCK